SRAAAAQGRARDVPGRRAARRRAHAGRQVGREQRLRVRVRGPGPARRAGPGARDLRGLHARRGPNRSDRSRALSPANKRIVVTGMGINTPIGDNLDDFYSNLIAGKSAISKWKWLDNPSV